MKLKIITLNIWEGIFLDKAIDFFKAESADVLLLQEVYGLNATDAKKQFRTLETLQSSLGLPYSYFVPGLRHNREEGKFLVGNAIFSKYPILEKDAVFFNDPYNDDFVVHPKFNAHYPHTLQHVVLETSAGNINVFNLHGAWDLDGDNYSEQRQQMSDAIINAVKDKSRVILAGDTNAKPTNEAMRRVEQYLTSVFGDTLATTFNMSQKDNPGYATAAVDMMFISKDVRVVEKSCPDIDISDHLPLKAVLEIQ